MASDLTEPPGDVDLLDIARYAVGVYRRSHYVPPSGRDDLLSDACLGAVKGARSYNPDGGSTLGAWVYCRAFSEILDGLRRRGPIARTDWLAGVRSPDDLPEHRKAPASIEHEEWTRQVPDPIDRYALVDEALDDRALVGRLLAVLPARERQVVERRYLANEQGQVIAADLGVSPGRISQIVHAACDHMRAAA